MKLVDVSYKVPVWGSMTCVVGTEWKEGTYNGVNFAHTIVYGVSFKEQQDGTLLVVSEHFKTKKRVDFKPGTVICIKFNRFGQVEELLPLNS